jgi:phosphoribosylamine--glycine ligase
MRILILGGGAREHALAWTLADERDVDDLLCVPGNPGIRALARTLAVPLEDVDVLVDLALREQIDLTIVGPEAPLARGVRDRFEEAGLTLFGPSRTAARLEASKAFAREFMTRHAIPSPRYRICDRAEEALAAVHGGEFGFPVVIKADGLAAGKGVTIAGDRTAAAAAIRETMEERRFGDAGARLLIEECLEGVEASFFALCDGTRALPFGSAQDHKRVFDDDRGPNTGGMGAFSPSPLVDDEIEARVMRDIVEPVLAGTRAEGAPFGGFLYVGLMITADGPKVVEFNVRFGDPEAQVVLPRIESPLAPLLYAAATGALGAQTCRFSSRPHVGVVLASGGYPDAFERGRLIQGWQEAERMSDVLVFHAGTASRGTDLVTDGGRVLTVVGRGDDFASAIDRAYAAADRIDFEGRHMRRDIGRKALGSRCLESSS